MQVMLLYQTGEATSRWSSSLESKLQIGLAAVRNKAKTSLSATKAMVVSTLLIVGSLSLRRC